MEASAENGQNGVSAVGVERGIIVFFGSTQETTCPFKDRFHCLHLSSALRRPEHSQALLPALEVTPLKQFISTITALQRREQGAGRFFHFSLL